MHESEPLVAAVHRRPHNIINLQMRQCDSEVASGWKGYSIGERLESIVFVAQFAGIVAKKVFEISYTSATNAIDRLTSGD
jgi:hypothetical protein